MKILNFVKRLLPRIERTTVQEDLRTTEREVSNVSIPSWDSAATIFKINKPKSPEVLSLQSIFYHTFNLGRVSKSSSFIEDIAKRLKNFHDNVSFIQDILEDMLPKDIIGSGLSVKQAFIVRASGNVSYVSRYLLNLLNYIYVHESQAHDNDTAAALELSASEIKYVENNFVRFVRLFQEYSKDPKVYQEELKRLADNELSERTAGMLSGLTGAEDPLEPVGLSGFVGSPILAVRLAYATWQNSRYEASKAKKAQLELRLLYLEGQMKNHQDPKIANEISRLQDRIDILDAKIRETDEELGI